MKLRAGTVRVFNPVGWDLLDPPYGVAAGLLKPGDKVKVIKLPGAPPPGTMGHYHVARVSDGEFVGLVTGASLAGRA
jgi:hypothetical protein